VHLRQQRPLNWDVSFASTRAVARPDFAESFVGSAPFFLTPSRNAVLVARLTCHESGSQREGLAKQGRAIFFQRLPDAGFLLRLVTGNRRIDHGLGVARDPW